MAATLDRDVVYHVRSDQDPTALLAVRGGIKDGWVFWDDTTRDRAHRVERIEVIGPDVVVHVEGGWVYAFRPLTVESYERWVRAHVELSPSIKTQAELDALYRRVMP
ncbi:MAG: hypothetical protein HYV07_08995 [Deltaproteobacteria bacterium]|nr:hypothetical protein [Deltaproteobacteria bacterium]